MVARTRRREPSPRRRPRTAPRRSGRLSGATLAALSLPFILGAERATAQPRPALAAVPASSALERADSLYAAGAATASLAVLDVHLERAPHDYEARWRAARAAVSAGLLAPAEPEQNEWYRRGMAHGEAAVQLRPAGVDGLWWLTANQGRLALQIPFRASAAAAQEVQERARLLLSLDSLHAGAYNALGKIGFEYLRLSRLERLFARTFLRREVFRDVTWERTLAYQQRAAELAPAEPLVHFDLGRTYLYTGRYELAERELQRALDLPNRHPGDDLFKREAREALRFARERRRP